MSVVETTIDIDDLASSTVEHFPGIVIIRLAPGIVLRILGAVDEVETYLNVWRMDLNTPRRDDP